MDKSKNQVTATSKAGKINTNFKASASRSVNSNAVVQLLTTDGADKLAPQAQKIIECLVAAKDHKLTIRQICGEDAAGLNSYLDAVGLVTEQTPAKIFNHYRAKMIKGGFISVS
tara:strand:+ start:500 stop:841 length:342 start_codon:yes stop_codon:yes gene_type:complete